MDALLVLSGVVITGLMNGLLDWRRRAHDRDLRSEDRQQSHADAERERQRSTYQTALQRLRAVHTALHRATDVLYGDLKGLEYPFSPKGTVDWAIDEIDSLRSVQADIDLFGSPWVAKVFAEVMSTAEAFRWSLGMLHDWDTDWASSRLNNFDEQFDTVREAMRKDLGAQTLHPT